MYQSSQAQCIKIDLSSLHLLCTLTNEHLVIDGQDTNTHSIFHCQLKNDRLPLSFVNIFDSVEDLFCFLKDTGGQDIQLIRNTLKIKVKINNFNKCITVDIPVEMQVVQNQNNSSEIRKLKQKLQILQSEVLMLRLQLEKSVESEKRLYNRIKENQQRIKALERRDIGSQSARSEPIDSIAQNVKTQVIGNNVKPFNKTQQQKDNEIILNQDIRPSINTPLQRLKSITKQTSERMQKEISFTHHDTHHFREGVLSEGKNRNFQFEIDTSNSNIEAFTIKRNCITRKNIQNDIPFQLYSLNNIPERGRYSFIYQILSKSPNSMSIGLITQQQKEMNCIREQTAVVMMNCEKGYELYVDGRPKSTMLNDIKPKTYLQFMVQLSSRKVKITKNGNKQQAIRFELPQHFLKKKIYPFVQMMCADDSIEINVIA